MLAILEPFCPPTMVGTIQPLPHVASRHDRFTAAAEQAKEPATLPHPLTGIVDEPEAKELILEMLQSGTTESVIRSIFDTGYYEIVVPSRIAVVPYLAITFTNDIAEGYEHDLYSHPPQDHVFLTTPKPGMTATDRGECEDEAWDRLQWGSIEYQQESGEMASIPFPVLYTIAEYEDLEPVSGLQIYFTGSDDSSFDLCIPSMDGTIEPWRLSKSKPSSPQMDLWLRDWSDDYELGDVQNLLVDEGLDQDSGVSSSSGSTFADVDMEWANGAETELTEFDD